MLVVIVIPLNVIHYCGILLEWLTGAWFDNWTVQRKGYVACETQMLCSLITFWIIKMLHLARCVSLGMHKDLNVKIWCVTTSCGVRATQNIIFYLTSGGYCGKEQLMELVSGITVTPCSAASFLFSSAVFSLWNKNVLWKTPLVDWC